MLTADEDFGHIAKHSTLKLMDPLAPASCIGGTAADPDAALTLRPAHAPHPAAAFSTLRGCPGTRVVFMTAACDLGAPVWYAGRASAQATFTSARPEYRADAYTWPSLAPERKRPWRRRCGTQVDGVDGGDRGLPRRRAHRNRQSRPRQRAA